MTTTRMRASTGTGTLIPIPTRIPTSMTAITPTSRPTSIVTSVTRVSMTMFIVTEITRMSTRTAKSRCGTRMAGAHTTPMVSI